MSLLVNALVIHVLSARSGLWYGLTCADGRQACEDGLVASHLFKTNTKYQIQVMHFDDDTRSLMNDYMKVADL